MSNTFGHVGDANHGTNERDQIAQKANMCGQFWTCSNMLSHKHSCSYHLLSALSLRLIRIPLLLSNTVASTTERCDKGYGMLHSDTVAMKKMNENDDNKVLQVLMPYHDRCVG
ncbi:hypothetical protein Y032_0332g2750 [Ancylostoma ceylanicum]|uniref:Uncharacterized protein n=1 Tax=Ancylostoma ceylanicum TaxID=53326 RepID=A0A016RZW1_9BILA|nr:hypothetical protein Y032_0332g2750 [Ancylostoma ceylanicum]